MAKLTVEIPDALLSKLELTGQPLQTVVLEALQQYAAQSREFPITETETWQLCGQLEVPEPEAKYIVGLDDRGQVMTNYAEQINDVLY